MWVYNSSVRWLSKLNTAVAENCHDSSSAGSVLRCLSTLFSTMDEICNYRCRHVKKVRNLAAPCTYSSYYYYVGDACEFVISRRRQTPSLSPTASTWSASAGARPWRRLSPRLDAESSSGGRLTSTRRWSS